MAQVNDLPPGFEEVKSTELPAGFEEVKAEPFDVKKQNAIMLGNMAKQKDAGKQDLLSDFANSGPMGDVMQGLNKGHEGNYAGATHGIVKGVSKVLAPAALPAVVAAPAVAAGGLLLGAAGDYGGRKAASLVTDNPDYQDVAGDVGGLLGGVVGGEGTAKYGPAVGDALIERAARLKEIPAFQRSHAPAAAASMILGPQAGAAVEVAQNPLANEMAGKLLKRNVPWQTPKGAVGLPVIDRNMPNVSPDAAERQLFAPSAESVPGTGVVGNETPPSEKTIPDAYRKELLDAMAKERESKNAAFDANAASVDPLSAGATPQEIAAKYAESKGLAAPEPHPAAKVDPEQQKLIAAAYEKMQHNPDDPRVRQAYQALQRETADQFHYIKAHTGLQTEPYTGLGEPYKNSAEMFKDINENNHLSYKPTAAAGNFAPNHPMLETLQTGPDGKPGEMNYNDMFRIVHDYMAHAKGGHQFGPNGELNAYLEHAKLFSPDAKAALATETLGQGAANFSGPRGAFVQQKAGLLPPELRGLNPENVKPALGNEDSLKANAALGNAEDHAVIAEAGKAPVERSGLNLKLMRHYEEHAAAGKPLYHGTTTNAAAGFGEKGITPAGSPGADTAANFSAGGERKPSVYLTTSKADAEAYARLAAKAHGGEPHVAEVYVPPAEVGRLKPDESHFGSVRSESAIPPEWLQKPENPTTESIVARKTRELQDYLKAQMANPEAGKNVEVAPAGKTTTNGSGGHEVSAEEIARVKEVTDKGGEFIVRQNNPGGKPIDRKVSDPKAIADPEGWLKPNEKLIAVDKDGNEVVRAHGTKGGAMSPQEKDLIGNRGAGAMNQAERLRLFREQYVRRQP